MRIILGKNKGKRLIAPANLPVRPTTDFAKEALFNIINNYFYFDEISVLDLFSVFIDSFEINISLCFISSST